MKYIVLVMLVLAGVIISGCTGEKPATIKEIEGLSVTAQAVRSSDLGQDEYFVNVSIKNMRNTPVRIRQAYAIFGVGGAGVPVIVTKEIGAKLESAPGETEYFEFGSDGWTDKLLSTAKSEGTPPLFRVALYDEKGQNIGQGEFKGELPELQSLNYYNKYGKEPISGGYQLELTFRKIT